MSAALGAGGRPQARHPLERLNGLYAMLSGIARDIVRADDPHVLYAAACRHAVEAGGFACAWISLLEPAGQRLQHVASAGAAVALERVAVSAADEDGCPVGRAIREGCVCVADGVAAAAADAAWPGALGEAGVRALAALPLWLEGQCVGAYVVGGSEPGMFGDAELRLLAEAAEDLAFALAAIRHEDRRIAAETRVQYLAYYDAQTGLPGAALFAERVATAGENGHAFAVLVVNLRRYHAILQALGQTAGAELVRAAVERLENLLPACATGRLSESEFACLLEDADAAPAEEAAGRVQHGLAERLVVAGREVSLEPFVGIALHPRDGAPEEALKAARIAALAGADEAGGRFRQFVAGMDSGSRRRLDLEAALRRALVQREYVLHYQPQVDLASGRVIGAEALLRWQRPGHGLVSPAEFIPLLEETGLIVPVGEWVLHEACRHAQFCQDLGLAPVRVAVNVAARQFQEADFAARVRQALAQSGLAPNWLELEITETSVLLDADSVIHTMNALRALGVSHALDDFGTGYSSLSYLQRLPVERLKIDCSFVASITTNPGDAAIVRAVVGMAHSLGLTVIAEGVETEGQLGYLRGLECEEIQGYYFSRPLPAADFVALLQRGAGLPPAVSQLGRPPRVLLAVDDEPLVLAALRRALRQGDIEVLTARSAEEGFELLATRPVGVVMCSQRMPGITGTEFLRRVRELHPGVVRIVLSGYTDLNSVIDAVNRGAIYKFFAKPWEDEALLAGLRDAFHLHEMAWENREFSRRVKALQAGREATSRPPAGAAG